MELILLENILNLGNIGDKVKVKNGYGRNFLLKQGKALRYNKENQQFVDKKKVELNKKNAKLFYFIKKVRKMEIYMVQLNLKKLRILLKKRLKLK